MRKVLKKIFNYNNWHISPLLSRKYAQELILFLNKLENNKNYLEIGCGLGDIIRNVNFKKRLGLDYEKEVLRAARFLSLLSFQPNIIYRNFTFPIDQIEGKFDVIVLVNWIHNIEPEILKSKLSDYFQINLNRNGMIIIDTIQNNEYKYNHKVNFLAENLLCEINRIGKYENQREIWEIIKK
ncbi:MAG TPA: class I SAM-dependent methyltransferase [Candidatus Paceibacterota bacterium]